SPRPVGTSTSPTPGGTADVDEPRGLPDDVPRPAADGTTADPVASVIGTAVTLPPPLVITIPSLGGLVPALQVPVITAPEITLPEITVPEITVPDVTVPVI